MNHKQNTHWTAEDDAKLIANQHKGLNHLHNIFGRSRKAIKTRLNVLKKKELNSNLIARYLDILDWVKYIHDNYDLTIEDKELLCLALHNDQ
jgi:hypothetical protein